MYAKHIYLSDGEYMVDIQDISNEIYAKHIHANTHPQNHLAAKWGAGSAESEGHSRHLHPCHQVSKMLMLYQCISDYHCHQHDNGELLRDVGREDGGMYQCIAGNEEEESQAAAHLVLGGQFTSLSFLGEKDTKLAMAKLYDCQAF